MLYWTKKEVARAAIRLAVKKELHGKAPFSELDNLLKEVIEQAEGQYAPLGLYYSGLLTSSRFTS